MTSDVPDKGLVELIDDYFPRLADSGNYEQRSCPDENYNCIAFAVGKQNEWWWPGFRPEDYWPVPIPEEVDLQTFVSAFKSEGYRKCRHGRPQRHYEKIVLYAKNGEPTHAARLEASTGMWLSKLGEEHDIAHHGVADVGGEYYGEVVCYFRRRSHPPYWRSWLRALLRQRLAIGPLNRASRSVTTNSRLKETLRVAVGDDTSHLNLDSEPSFGMMIL